MLDWLPDFLDGLFNMLSDSNREIRQAADSAIGGFLIEIKRSSVVEFGPMVGILVNQCHNKERFNRLTAISWVKDFIKLGGDRLLLFYSELLGSVMHCISDSDFEIRQVAESTNVELLELVRSTNNTFELAPLLQTLTSELSSHHIPTRMASLRWINMLLRKVATEMNKFISDLLPALLRTLSDDADEVVLTNLEVLARISMLSEREFKRVLVAIVRLFGKDRRLLELRGSLIIRHLCVLLDAQSIYMSLATILKGSDCCVEESVLDHPSSLLDHPSGTRVAIPKAGSSGECQFRAIMVQTLSLILLTARELDELRSMLRSSLDGHASEEAARVFITLFEAWSHNPVATLGLCLIAQAYRLASALVILFADVDVSVGFLMQIDKLVQLLESPIFIHLRLQLLEVQASYHPYLMKSLYGVLMLLPQSAAFSTLSSRLATVSTLHVHVTQSTRASQDEEVPAEHECLLATFKHVQLSHAQARHLSYLTPET
mmetsp:Transcript_8915/g.36822  ORF Transcript_8915/g.36822 Transcript_8915/m.36822 type:complete len:489 (+) Transcript_8915:973-2439(+)